MRSTLGIEDVVFPVEVWSVFVKPNTPTSSIATPRMGVPDISLFDLEDEHEDPYLPAHEQRAIVDVERQRVFAIVSANYSLVTNANAITLGQKCFRQVFSQSTLDQMEVFSVVMPSTRSFCHIDYTLRGYQFTYGSSDAWKPFLRITNSYNRTKPLQFDLGFCRAICRNGMIFGAQQMNVRRYHSHGEASVSKLDGIDFKALKQLETQFLEQLHNLGRFAVPPAMMLPLACKVFDWKVNEDQLRTRSVRERIRERALRVADLSARYFDELGHNAYAALNVLTDFASRPAGLGFSDVSHIHALQERSGNWIDEFIPTVERREFRFEKYVEAYMDSARVIQRA